MNPFTNIAVAGSGNLAEALCAALSQTAGINLTLVARNAERGRLIASSCGCRHVAFDSLPDDIDLCIIAVSDSAIASVAAALDLPADAVVVHTSGATDIGLLPERFARRGVIYPLQTFTAGRRVDFAAIPLFVEGSDAATQASLLGFAGLLSRRVAPADSATRRRIHLAGVFACNFANAMYGIGSRIMADAGFGFDMLRPLIAETAAKAVEAQSPADVQTGPAVRGDRGSMERHMELLADERRLAEIYKLTSEEIWEISKRT